jgi:flavorubredoxin
MSAIKITNNAYWVGVKDSNLKKFDIIMNLKHGTTYNAYLVKGEKVAIIDTVKKGFTEEFLNNIREIVPIQNISYLIINHTEPDHSGAIMALIKENPNIEIICSASAVPFVKNVINTEIPIRGVKDNEILDLGGRALTFKIMPYMHWPDTMMEFLSGDEILFSCDGFAAHLAEESIFMGKSNDEYNRQFHYYWDAIMRPFSSYIRKNLPKLDALEIKIIAPSHGPIIGETAKEYIDKYKEWIADKTASANLVSIIYASNYDNTKVLAEKIGEKMKQNGFNTALIDASECDHEQVRDKIEASKAVVIGTPTFNGDAVKPIWDIVNLFSTVSSIGKKAAIFGSYGWSGEGPKLVAERLTGLKLKVFEEIYKVRLIPSEAELQLLNEYCDRMIQFLKN